MASSESRPNSRTWKGSYPETLSRKLEVPVLIDIATLAAEKVFKMLQ
jgi:hypothetical protein